MVAVDRLERIPDEIEFFDAGLKFPLLVHTRNWIRSPLYKASDLPKPPQRFTKPTRSSVLGFKPKLVEDTVHVSRRVLVSLCEGRALDSLPPEVRAFMDSTSTSAEIPMAQVETLVELPELNPGRGSSDDALDGGNPNYDAHAPPNTSFEPPQVILEQGSQPSGGSFSTNGAVAGQTEGTRARNTKPKRLTPQQISPPIQILRRTLPQNDPPVGGPALTGDRKGLEGSDSLSSHSADRAQIGEKNNSLTSGQRTRAKEVAHSNRSMPVVGASRDRMGHKPKKGLLSQIPLKPTFKKMVKHSAAQVKQKKEAPSAASTGPSTGQIKGKENENSDRAHLNLNPEGFYEVAVQYSHLVALGDGCGIATVKVAQALEEDNIHRRLNPSGEDQDIPEDRLGPDLHIDSEEEDLNDDVELDLV